MFASRFDPSQLKAAVTAAPEKTVKPTPQAIVPLKRQATGPASEDDDASDQESDDSSEKNAGMMNACKWSVGLAKKSPAK